MNDLSLTIIHLLHTMRVEPSAIFADDFVESFNLNLKNPSLNEKTQHLTLLKDDGYIQIDNNGYMGLTQQGGKFWEKHFLIDWQLYFVNLLAIKNMCFLCRKARNHQISNKTQQRFI